MQTATMTEAANERSAATRSGKYLTFHLGAEEYGIRVLKVREIVKIQHITGVPDTPAEIRGVINLRGKVIPVIDLRLKFGLAEKEYDQRTCIIVVEAHGRSQGLMGIIVDEVSEVLNLQDGDVQDTPDFGKEVETPYLLGMAKVKDKVKILLDIDQVLAASDLNALGAALR
jgi:purine-binding chemotaxis protein CheW